METRFRCDRSAPTGRLVIVDRPYDVCWNGILPIRSKRHQQRNRHIVRLKHPGHVDDVVGSLRVAHQYERVGLALDTLPHDFVCRSFPIQMTSYLGADALGLERLSDFVKTCREHTEPTSQ